ncbi:MAG: methyl-accepting chemotaxis protein [Pseudomonadota bacterium]
MSIARKLPLMIVGAGGLVGICVGIAAYLNAAATLKEEAFVRLEALKAGHKQNLTGYLETIEQDLRIIASSDVTREAALDFAEAWDALGERPTETLQRLYIEENPHPTGQKENLDVASDGSDYSKAHAEYHPWFRQVLRERGYYDIFIFDNEGNLVYTVFKELDFATNLVSGKWRDTDLGNAFRAVRDNPTENFQAFFDFRGYGPSFGAPASFISRPILDKDGSFIGALAFQMPIDHINGLMQEAHGLGETGETFLVGDDFLMRSDSRFSEESTILSRRIETEPVREALAGHHDVTAKVSADGVPVIAAFEPVDFAGVRWALIAQMSRDEIMAPATALAWRIFAITIAALLALSFLGWALAKGIVKPLVGIVDAVASMIKGETVQVPGSNRNDEIGILARSMDTVYQKGLEAVRLRSALDGCSTMVLVANRHCKIVYVNPALNEFFKLYEGAIKGDVGGVNIGDLTGEDIGIFHKDLAKISGTQSGHVGTSRLQISLGGRSLHLAVSPIVNEIQTFLGLVIEWSDVTTDLAIQGEIDRVIAAARQGEFDEQVDLHDAEGVNRRLADGMNQLTTVMSTATNELGTVLEAFASGDLSKRIDVDFSGRLGDLKNHANRTAEQLSTTVAQIQAVTGEVENAAAEISSGTADLSNRTEQAAANLEETAASTEQVSATVKQNAERAKSASELAETANRVATKGGEVVEQAVGAMSGIEESAQKITDIISVIDEIAFQTNLLALNASVEAARAGEAGKGFAVVAQEVRQLAQRSAKAASDIKNLIQDSNRQVGDGVQLVNQAGEALGEIVDSIGKVTGIVRQISDASQEQALGVQEINGSINSMDEMTQQNSALVEESTAAARALSDQASQLNALMGFFKLDEHIVPKPIKSASQPQPQKPAASPRPAKAERAAAPAMATASDDGWSEF